MATRELPRGDEKRKTEEKALRFVTGWGTEHMVLPSPMFCSPMPSFLRSSEALLQDALYDVDWDIFWSSSADISEFMDVAIIFVSMLIENTTHTITIRTFSNHKPWVNKTIRAVVNLHTTTYNAGLMSGNMIEHKALCYTL